MKNIQQFLEEENKKTLRFVKMLVMTRDKQQIENGWLQEHNASLINFILSEVEREVEELYRHTVTGKVEDVLLVRRKDISTIINNLRVN